MTKAQIWVASFLGLFIILFFLQRLTTETPSGAGHPMGMEQSAGGGGPEAGSSETDAKALIERGGCMSCHGADLNGTKMAPALTNLGGYYDRDKLINYLRNPNSFMDEGRFRAYKEQYKNIIMPSYNNYDVKDLGKMADYLLAR